MTSLSIPALPLGTSLGSESVGQGAAVPNQFGDRSSSTCSWWCKLLPHSCYPDSDSMCGEQAQHVISEEQPFQDVSPLHFTWRSGLRSHGGLRLSSVFSMRIMCSQVCGLQSGFMEKTCVCGVYHDVFLLHVFASFVAETLRAPIDVAEGTLKLMRRKCKHVGSTYCLAEVDLTSINMEWTLSSLEWICASPMSRNDPYITALGSPIISKTSVKLRALARCFVF